jgi:hypothetical protein
MWSYSNENANLAEVKTENVMLKAELAAKNERIEALKQEISHEMIESEKANARLVTMEQKYKLREAELAAMQETLRILKGKGNGSEKD